MLTTAPCAADDGVDVAVIGGGFAGTVVAVQLARLAPRPLRIAMFDRAGAFGRGAAYGPLADHCILNVRAHAMGAFPDAEDDFAHWLRAAGYAADDPELGERFVPRRLYGDYLQALLDRCTARGTLLLRRTAEIVDVEPHAGGFRLATADGQQIGAGSVVVAIGNLPSAGFADPALAAAMAAHARNAWDVLAGNAIDPSADVLIVGTGLTALDVVLELDAGAHRGRITMLSRHGRFPLPHLPPGRSSPCAAPPLNGSPRTVLRQVRRLIAAAEAGGRSWHDAVDGLRPQLDTIWQQWTEAEQRQFNRHLASRWDVHRHRAPASTLAVRDALRAAGRLTVRRGCLTRVAPAPPGVTVTYRDRADGGLRELRVDAIVDCTGPRRALARSGEALIGALLRRRLARPGPHGVGLAAAPGGRLAAADVPLLYALGTPLRGSFAESTAVREIRQQARAIAESIVNGLAVSAVGAR